MIFADNNLNDGEISDLLLAMKSASSRIKSIVSVRNDFGEKSLKSIQEIFGEPNDETKIKYVEELNLNGAKVLRKSILGQLILSIAERNPKIKKLGLSGHLLDD